MLLGPKSMKMEVGSVFIWDRWGQALLEVDWGSRGQSRQWLVHSGVTPDSHMVSRQSRATRGTHEELQEGCCFKKLEVFILKVEKAILQITKSESFDQFSLFFFCVCVYSYWPKTEAFASIKSLAKGGLYVSVTSLRFLSNKPLVSLSCQIYYSEFPRVRCPQERLTIRFMV